VPILVDGDGPRHKIIDSNYLMAIANERGLLFVGRQLPQPQGAVPTAGKGVATIGRKRNALDDSPVTWKAL
jgi:hypothetical protein